MSSPSPAPRSAWIQVAGDVVISALVAITVFGAIQWWQGRDFSGRLVAGEVAPAFELRDGRTREVVQLSALRGRPVVLNFWATWCRPCRDEMPALERLAQAAGDTLHVVTLTTDDPGLVTRFLDTGGYTLRCLMDATGEVSQRYRVSSLPRTVVLDASGKVAWDVVGQVDMRALRDVLSTLTR